jgi:RNA polymerase sigma-70 factor (ECF subfamily)
VLENDLFPCVRPCSPAAARRDQQGDLRSAVSPVDVREGNPDDVRFDHGPMTGTTTSTITGVGSGRQVPPRFIPRQADRRRAGPDATVLDGAVLDRAVQDRAVLDRAVLDRAVLDGDTGPGAADGDRDAAAGGEPDHRAVFDALVERAVTGDARARDELLGLIQPLVLRYCRARLGRQESLMGSAEDVAQEVCVAVVGALPHYQLKGLSFRAFVYGIAAHKVTDAFRVIGRNRTEPVADLPDAPTTGDGPENRLLAAEMSTRLAQLLDQLTPRQREVLLLRMAAGLSAEETAHVVRSTPGAVRVTQHRALGRLRRIVLGEAAAEAGDATVADLAHDGQAGARAAFLDGGAPVSVSGRSGTRGRR